MKYREWEEQIEPYIIAQDDDRDYDESGYVVVVRDGRAALTGYSHCSCYGTASAIDDANLTKWLWSGTEDELKRMALGILDPAMPEREADSKDYDYDHLLAVYDQVLAHYGLVRENGA